MGLCRVGPCLDIKVCHLEGFRGMFAPVMEKEDGDKIKS